MSSGFCALSTGTEITGVSRNTRKVYGDLPGDLPGPISYRVFRETAPWPLNQMGLLHAGNFSKRFRYLRCFQVDLLRGRYRSKSRGLFCNGTIESIWFSLEVLNHNLFSNCELSFFATFIYPKFLIALLVEKNLYTEVRASQL